MKKRTKGENASEDRLSLNLAILGGGRACKFFLELMERHSYNHLDVEIAGVCDINPDAEGLRYAREKGIFTTDSLEELLDLDGLDSVLELTGRRDVLMELIRLRPKGLGVIEHNIGKILRDLFMKEQELESVVDEAVLDKLAADFFIQQANERISIINPHFEIIEANEAYLKTAGKTREEVIGAHCYEISHGLSVPCSSGRPGLGCPLLETLRTGESAHVLHEHTFSGREPTYCDLVTYPLKDKHGEVARVIEVGRDLTDELSHRWENRVREIEDNLKKIIQEDRLISLGKLVASSVHEINNPIQGLMTFSHLMEDMLRDREPSPEDLDDFRKYLSLMSGELARCGDIISGLLSFSRQSGMEYRDIDLNDILEQVVSLTRHKMELQDIQLDKKLHAGPVIIDGDMNQLQQCFLNLIFNAIEAMPEGGELLVRCERVEEDGKAVVKIGDTGVGIAESEIDHIFDPFFTTKQEGEGTGMGLSIVYGIVRNHGGNIRVDSREGKGTTFIMVFPMHQSSIE
jgi:signal transduction histidine kinase